MKILSIAGRNLNSLRVEFKIDFTSDVLRECGIFAITGPTGAGKTTLLDAITLALYGKTPRSATDEDIISYGAGEAWAEVIFQTPEGCFKSEWKVRRARSKHDGALQQSNMEVSSYPDGKILTHKKREAQDKVKELIKLDYDQFLKSVLLAQGAFKAFLDAKEGERGEMLEKISDTSLYTKLSKRAFERKRKEEQVLEMLRASVGNVVLLTDDERYATETNITNRKEEEKNLQKELADLQVKLNWLKTISDLTYKQLEAENEVKLAAQRLEDEQPSLQRWEAHQKVAGLELPWMQYLAKKEESLLQQQNIEKYEAKLLLLSTKIKDANAFQTQALNQLQTAVKMREEKMPVILEAITRQGDLKAEKKQLGIIEEKLKAKSSEESSYKVKILNNEANLLNSKKKLADLDTWLNEHRHYAEANNSCTQASLLVSYLKRCGEDIELQQINIAEADNQIAAAREQISRALEHEEEANNEQQVLAQLSTRVIRQLSILKSQLITELAENNVLLEKTIRLSEEHQNELSRQEFLAEHLSRLHEGEPCPLCGAADHPNQTLSITDVQAGINQLQALIKQDQNMIKTTSLKQKTIERLLANIEEFVEHEEVYNEHLPQDFEAVFKVLIQEQRLLPQKHHAVLLKQASAKQLKQSLEDSISDLGKGKEVAIRKMEQVRGTRALHINALDEIASPFQLKFEITSPASLPNELKKYSEEYHNKSREFSELSGSIPSLQSGIEIITDQINALQNDISQLVVDAADKKNIVQRYSDEITLAYLGYASPQAAKEKLNADEKLAGELVKKTSEQLNQLNQEMRQAAGEKNNAEFNLQELVLAIENLLTSLKSGLAALELGSDTELIRKHLLSKNERVILERLYKSLNDKLVLTTAQLNNCSSQLDLQKSLEMTTEDAESISTKMQRVAETLQEMNRELGRLQQVLKDDDVKQVRVQFVRKEIEAQEKNLYKWAELSRLIGSESGKKFNLFAQGLTLDRLLLVSNHHLQLLNDRYRLKRNKSDQGLRLLIIDQYQADNEREINTLSGGESFLVSLALALGLSEMTSKLTTIDSLFIDEGFGTLDADTLEVAINALRGLQISGKTIGIISHVERLKEEIYTQVEITKGADGFSTVKVIP